MGTGAPWPESLRCTSAFSSLTQSTGKVAVGREVDGNEVWELSCEHEELLRMADEQAGPSNERHSVLTGAPPGPSKMLDLKLYSNSQNSHPL